MYGISKLAAESILQRYANKYGLKSTSLRFSGLYGPSKFIGGAHMGTKIDHILTDFSKIKRLL